MCCGIFRPKIRPRVGLGDAGHSQGFTQPGVGSHSPGLIFSEGFWGVWDVPEPFFPPGEISAHATSHLSSHLGVMAGINCFAPVRCEMAGMGLISQISCLFLCEGRPGRADSQLPKEQHRVLPLQSALGATGGAQTHLPHGSSPSHTGSAFLSWAVV